VLLGHRHARRSPRTYPASCRTSGATASSARRARGGPSARQAWRLAEGPREFPGSRMGRSCSAGPATRSTRTMRFNGTYHGAMTYTR
jgi:hypothetical protein